MNHSSKRNRLWHRLLLLSVFIAIGLYIAANLEQITNQPLEISGKYIIAALLLTICAHLLSYAIWTRIAIDFDMHVSFLHAGKSWFLSRLGRYIPGKIAIFLIRFDSYAGHSKTKVGTATVFEAYTTLCATSVLLLLATSSTDSVISNSWLSATLLFFLISISHPGVIRGALSLLRRLFSLPKLDALPSHGWTLLYVCAQLIGMLVHGAALFMIFNAVGETSPDKYFMITAIYFIASLTGMLAVFAPSGIGVREGVLILGLSSIIEPATLIAGAILIRLAGIFSELLLTGLFTALHQRARPANK